MFIAWTTKLKWTISAKAHLRQLTFQLFFFLLLVFLIQPLQRVGLVPSHFFFCVRNKVSLK